MFKNDRYRENGDNLDNMKNREILICMENTSEIWKVGKFGKEGD